MATLSFGPMRTAKAVTTGNLYTIGDAAPDTIGSFLLTVESASGLTLLVKGAAPGATLASTSGALQLADLSAAGTVTAGATGITANGNYVVRADGCACLLDVTGSATVTVVPLRG